ncbi:MAG: hypothetical protein ACREAA_13120 [Candidatus Polarisedimenticolia bacterium]
MVTLGMLWLPILVSAVVVFVASFVMWMVMPHHKSDWRKLPDESGVSAALGKAPAGMYMIPYCDDAAKMKDQAFMKRYEEGPTGTILLRRRGPASMNGQLAMSFFYNLVVSFFVAYLASRTRPAGSESLEVFRVVGAATLLAYAGALFYPAIWMNRPWRVVAKDSMDALVYALLTAGVFGWLWPAA